jgi:site-specific DNA-methyltransferase (adenine-specific)
MDFNRVYNMDALKGLKALPSNCIDAIISDPPYQLSSITKSRADQTIEGAYGREVPFSRVQAKKGFMNMEWDTLPDVNILKESLRVLKPGAFSLWLMTPRQDSQMEFLLRLREAGFVISFSPIYWAYATGFPKGENIGKIVDRKMGRQRLITSIDKKYGRGDSGIYNMNVNGVDKKEFKRYDMPASEESKKLDGAYAGFQPKPAVELIIVAMKPLSEKTYVEQAIKNGKGITWLGNCRIPHNVNARTTERTASYKRYAEKIGWNAGYKSPGVLATPDKRGRFPANLIVSDNALDIGVIKRGKQYIGSVKDAMGSGNSLTFKHNNGVEYGYNDKGDISRYFSLDAWWQQKLNDLPPDIKRTFPIMYIPKPSPNEKEAGVNKKKEKKWLDYGKGTGITDRQNVESMNIHPTVKPIKLMSYCITLTTQLNDVVLDMFMGSGTTAISSIITGRQFIGFEREEKYFKIAQDRINYYLEKNIKKLELYLDAK